MRMPYQTLQDVERQYRWFEEMRVRHPVWLDDASGCWHVFRYEDVNSILADHMRFSSDFSRRFPANAGLAGPNLLRMDPPRHNQYRALIAAAFTARALSPLSERITAITQDLLDRVRPTGRMDVIGDLAYPLPTTVIAEMLGVPTDDRPLFKRWADALFAMQLSDQELMRSDEPESVRQVRPIFDEMSDYFTLKLEERRREPQADLMSKLLADEVDGAPLPQEDIISFCFLLLFAGHVTTTNLIGNAILCLDAHPEAMDQLCRQPEFMPGAIEEVLRFASPVWRTARMTTGEVTIGQLVIPANSVVFVWLASANRDSAQFPEPNRFDITRSPNHHVAFGHGIHFCVGAPLARMEAAIALPMMLEQLSRLRRVREVPVEVFDTRGLLGVRRLPATFTPSLPFASAGREIEDVIHAHEGPQPAQ